MDLKEHIVGEVEGYPVIYIEEKDLRFEIKHNWYTYSSLFVHKLIIRNYRILL